jgi:hypothetical protein
MCIPGMTSRQWRQTANDVRMDHDGMVVEVVDVSVCNSQPPSARWWYCGVMNMMILYFCTAMLILWCYYEYDDIVIDYCCAVCIVGQQLLEVQAIHAVFCFICSEYARIWRVAFAVLTNKMLCVTMFCIADCWTMDSIVGLSVCFCLWQIVFGSVVFCHLCCLPVAILWLHCHLILLCACGKFVRLSVQYCAHIVTCCVPVASIVTCCVPVANLR